VVVLIALLAAAFGFALFRHHAEVERADALWRARRPASLGDFGTTQQLTILPLLDWHAARPDLATEMGVSYLVVTDHTTVLFDTGNNARNAEPAPLAANMKALGVALADVDAVVISHAHFDHVGGRRWTDGAVSGTTFGIGNEQPVLADKRVLTAIPMTYPGIEPEPASAPTRVAPGVATTGTIPRKLFAGWIDEQALAVHIAGKGIILIVGCGHQTLARLIERAEAIFDAPIHGVVGGLHYPVPRGRLPLAGIIDIQRWFASGDGPLAPLSVDEVDHELGLLERRKIGLLAIGGHDSSDEVIARARVRFGAAYRDLRVGQPIVVMGVRAEAAHEQQGRTRGPRGDLADRGGAS
jgi:metal-dependent hydrolase (beta-lactamase superfamily II)